MKNEDRNSLSREEMQESFDIVKRADRILSLCSIPPTLRERAAKFFGRISFFLGYWTRRKEKK